MGRGGEGGGTQSDTTLKHPSGVVMDVLEKLTSLFYCRTSSNLVSLCLNTVTSWHALSLLSLPMFH